MKVIYYIPAFDGSMYVGQTNNLSRRQTEHRKLLHKSNNPKYLYFRKLGMNKKDIKLYVLKYCDKHTVNELELKFIRMFGKLNKQKFNDKNDYRRQKLICNICGSEMNLSSLGRHKKRKHLSKNDLNKIIV